MTGRHYSVVVTLQSYPGFSYFCVNSYLLTESKVVNTMY